LQQIGHVVDGGLDDVHRVACDLRGPVGPSAQTVDPLGAAL